MILEYLIYLLLILGIIYLFQLLRKAYYKLRRLFRLALLFIKR